MFRKETHRDVTDEEFASFVEPHSNSVIHFMERIIAPEIAAFYIATGYYKNALWENSFEILINDSLEFINSDIQDYEKFKKNIKDLLFSKYLLVVIDEEPLLKIKEIQ